MQKNKKDTIIGVIFTLSLVLVISLIAYYLRVSRKEDIKLINNSFGYTKGIVIKKTVYKSRSINVKYIVNGKSYIESDGINAEDNVSEGDSIIVKYSTEKPELMITQFNDEF
ncbi:hypothetical protein SAMN05443634_1085 [Chishuiella changwenlii]|uniref:DUF3592 domain-containing protein n=1 Tax=Chishuiella changwenlii TaxID=1434701 RepID=A0A1M6ZPJ5_9FLAO|nr:hypothetical protein [Chishuiella changwenlii]GGE92960.1 hypothetical protein GCM10010984_08200 [Chishuiella changwenlii]SHL32381.1 hypothetical protein SAMN05443634_1085 [Chishuiella changwenlii]